MIFLFYQSLATAISKIFYGNSVSIFILTKTF